MADLLTSEPYKVKNMKLLKNDIDKDNVDET